MNKYRYEEERQPSKISVSKLHRTPGSWNITEQTNLKKNKCTGNVEGVSFNISILNTVTILKFHISPEAIIVQLFEV